MISLIIPKRFYHNLKSFTGNRTKAENRLHLFLKNYKMYNDDKVVENNYCNIQVRCLKVRRNLENQEYERITIEDCLLYAEK